MPITNSKAFRYFEMVARVIVACVLAWAAWPKLRDPNTFAEAIFNYRVIDESLSGLVATFLPALEVVVALVLLTGIYARGAALIALAMFGVFIVAMSQAILRGINIDCGCFGSSMKAEVSWLSIARNVLFALLTLPTLVRRSQPTNPDPTG